MSGPSVDAIVVGAGPNGLVAANLLVDAGWSVTVYEAASAPGGAVRTEELTAPGFRNDTFSAFYPLAAASPVLARLQLEEFGLRWAHAPAVLAHPRLGRDAALLERDVSATAARLDADAPGDGAEYTAVVEQWRRLRAALVDALLSPFPPVRGAVRLARAASFADLRELARLAVVPVRRDVHERFCGDAARLLVAGSALHADLTPESAGGALFGWLLTALAHDVGFPVPVGGAGELTAALVRRLGAKGGTIVCDAPVERVLVHEGVATGVVVGGVERRCGRAVLADCDATALYTRLVGLDRLPAGFASDLRRIERAAATVKVDWALSRPIPWSDPAVSRAGTVHLAEGLDELTMTAAELTVGLVPRRPFVLLGQMTTADPTRSPPGTETAWAYTHVPQHVRGDADDGRPTVTGAWDERDCEEMVARIETRVEAHAPGFRDLVLARHVLSPLDMQRRDANLVGGDISGGSAQLHQQLVFRPVPGLARSETPVARLFLASASAHPGGGVHGACGANAARAAIAHDRLRRMAAGRLAAGISRRAAGRRSRLAAGR